MRLLERRGQSIGEYAILLGIVLGAVFAVQGYVRNTLAGGLMKASDNWLDDVDSTASKLSGPGAIQTVSDSVSRQELDFTTAETGTIGASSRGQSQTIGRD